VNMDATRPHSETLLPAVEKALSIAGRDHGDIEALAVGTGPGAFTGLRVGLATFKGWAFASRLPVLAVPSLDAVAFPVLKEGKKAMVVADARKGEVYVCYYPSLDDHGMPTRHGVPELIPIGEVPAWADTVGERNAMIIGTGAPLLIEAGMGGLREMAVDFAAHPSAAGILSIGEKMMSIGRTVEPSSLVPEYVRLPEARPQETGHRLPDP